MQLASGNESDSLKQKQNEEEEPQNTWHTRGICVYYQYLHNPFPNEEDKINVTTYSSNEELFAIIAGDKLTSLKDTQKSLNWPEWEKAIQNELTQLQQMGTWRLVEKLPNAILIANKWTIIKNRKRFSPIVQMETIQAILALVPIKGLEIQQMDVKGTYLNRQLKEKNLYVTT